MGLLGSLGAIVKQAPKVTAPAGGISIGGRATPAPGASLGRAAGQLAAKPAPRPTGGGIAIGGRASRPVGAPIGQAAGHAAALFHAYKTQPPAQQKAVLTGAILSHSPDGKNLLRMVAPQDSSLWSSKSLPDGLLKGLYGQSGGKALLGLANVAQKYGYVGESQRIARRYGLTIPWGQLMARDAGPKDQAAIHSIDVGLRVGQGQENQMLASQGMSAKQLAGLRGATSDRLKTAPAGNSLVSGAIADLGLNPGTVAASLGQAAHVAGVTGKFLSSSTVNAAKDLVQLPAEAYSTIAIPVSDVLQGKYKQAAQSVVGPFEQAFHHPLQMLSQHPLDSYLMASGVLHGATRALAGPARALAPADSGLGKALQTARKPVALTGNLTYERPAFSRSPSVKAGQVALEKAAYTRAPTGELVPRSDNLRATLIGRGVNAIFGARERIRRYNREAVRQMRESAVRPSLPRRAANTAKTALAYNPKAAVIPGGDVLARIADGTIRRPDTIVGDLQKHLAQVSALRPELLDNPKLLAEHDAYVKSLSKALTDKRFLKNPGPAFAAAEKYRAEYAPTQEAARQLGHFGDFPREAIQRRELMHYAVTHMGAKFDPEAGLVASDGGPLPTQAVLDHLRGPQGTGGRLPAFTSDRPKSNSAFYVSSERRPMPKTQRNTLWAYQHGLTEPSHTSLTEQHILMQGVVDAHHSQNEYLNALMMKRQNGGLWGSHSAATADAPPGYVAINVSQPFHPKASLDQALQGTQPAALEEEAARRSLDLNERMRPESPGGRWALIDKTAVTALERNRNLVSPNPVLRAFRGLNTQFRQVALGTSAKHVPGVMAENVIRDVASGVGLRSWVTGRRLLSKARQIEPVAGKELRPRLAGGQMAGATDFARTHSTAEFYRGTNLYAPLKAFEQSMKSPGLRQMRTAWKGWSRLVIGSTKHVLEEQSQIAGLGKTALRQHGYAEAARTGGMVSAVQRLMGLHGQMLDDAARGLFDPAKLRQARGEINRIYGNWTDLSPTAKWGLMMSPFGLWWVNSVRFLARLPVDQPTATAALAGATVGTEKQRQQEGLSMFGANRLPAYMQGGIPAGGNVISENYYSPFGVANDPLETGASLIQPWLLPMLQGAGGVNYLWKPLTSPSNPKGRKTATAGDRAQYILNSALASFIPLYTKAQQLMEGGASPYDVSNKFPQPSTKQPGKGIGEGAKKSLLPFRKYKRTPPPSSSSSGSRAFTPGASSGVYSPGGSSGVYTP